VDGEWRSRMRDVTRVSNSIMGLEMSNNDVVRPLFGERCVVPIVTTSARWTWLETSVASPYRY